VSGPVSAWTCRHCGRRYPVPSLARQCEARCEAMLSELTIGSLFSGVGGLDMGVMEALGGTVAWHAEFEDAPSKILAHHWPNVPNLGDVTAVDWSAVEPVDIICGGSPCQDVSMAGARKGMRAGTRSGLWASMCDAIEAIRPGLVVWENVRGALSAGADSNVEPCPLCVGDGPATHLRALGRVLGDLAELGYDAGWEVVRASDIGAPHRRERVFVLAWPADTHHTGPQGPHDPPRTAPTRLGGHSQSRAGGPDLTLLPTPDVYSADRGGPQHPDKRRAGGHSVTLADQVSALLPTPRSTDGTKGGPNQRGSSGDLMPPSAVQLLPTPQSADSERTSLTMFRGDGNLTLLGATTSHTFGQYAPAIARWEAVLGRNAPPPTEPNAAGNQRLSARFVEFMMGLPDGHVTDVPGVSRNEALKALGNGVVPQQAAYAIRRILAAQERAAWASPPTAPAATSRPPAWTPPPATGRARCATAWTTYTTPAGHRGGPDETPLRDGSS